MNSIVLGGLIILVVSLIVFVYMLCKENLYEAICATIVVAAIVLIPVGVLTEHRWNTRIVTEEMTSVVQRVDAQKVLLEGEVQLRRLASEVILEEGDVITYQLTESGLVVVREIKTY